MKSVLRNSYFVLLLCGLCVSAVRSQTPIQTDRLIANEVQIITPALNPVSSVNAQVIGNGGSATYYYWIVAKFSAGNATPSNPALVISAPSTLSASNRIRVTWGQVAGATGYDVLRTTSAQLPNGAANIGRSLNQATVSYDDTGGAFVSYTVATLKPRQLASQFVSPYWDALGWVAPPVSSANHGRIYYDLTLNQWVASANGGAYSAFGAGAGAGIKTLTDGIGSVSTPIVTFLTGTLGNDLNIVAGIDSVAWNAPDASATARGLVTTGPQVFAGNKTFTGDTLMNGDLYVTGNFSTDHPIEITGEACGTAEANVGLFGFDPVTSQPCFSYDGSAPAPFPFPRLDQVLDPAADKTFIMGAHTLTVNGNSILMGAEFNLGVGINAQLVLSPTIISPLTTFPSLITSDTSGGLISSVQFSVPELGISGNNNLNQFVGFEPTVAGYGGTGHIGNFIGFQVGTQQTNMGTNTLDAITGYQFLDNTLLGATYAFYSEQNSGTNKWAFYGAGTAASHFGGLTDAPRFKSSGTALVAGDFVPSAGWGASGSVAVTSTSTDQSFHITVTAAGAGQGLNPTVAFTFKDGSWTTVPIFVCSMETGGTGALSFFTPDNTSATVLTLTYAGTPVATFTYKVACNGWGL